MELWDAYDRELNKLGVTLVRGEEVPDGMYHLVSEVIVKHTDGEFLLMQRAPTKHFGGMWEATAGGSALCGESPLDCARRELLEETGLSGELPVSARLCTTGTGAFMPNSCVLPITIRIPYGSRRARRRHLNGSALRN